MSDRLKLGLLLVVWMLSLRPVHADTSHAMSAPAPATAGFPMASTSPCQILSHRARKATDGACATGNLAVAEKACLNWLTVNAKSVLAGWNSVHGLYRSLYDSYRAADALYGQARVSAGEERWSDAARDYAQAKATAVEAAVWAPACEKGYWSLMSRLSVYLAQEDLYLNVDEACRSASVNYESLQNYRGLAETVRAGCASYERLRAHLADDADAQAADASARATP